MKKRIKKSRKLPVRAYLLHLTHYDPMWCRHKERERRFHLPLALNVVDAMAQAGMNTLIIDCADAVRYKSHPELVRRYTAPMRDLVKLAAYARRRGLDVVPKLNFSQSSWHQHNHWFRPHHLLFDNPEYWRRSFKLVDELVRACKPKRFFHIGMDEDHHRSVVQYVRAIKSLRDGLKKRGLRTVIWNDTAYPHGRAWVHAEKCLAAEPKLPKDVIETVWDYSRIQPEIIRRLRARGFTAWAAPGQKAELVEGWKKALLRLGGAGMVMTQWIPCRPENRARILGTIARLGPLYS